MNAIETEPGDDREDGVTETVRSTRNLLLEGLVIVASILLAFAIDAGWDELREREQERRLFVQLIEELDLFIGNLGPASRRVTDRVDADLERLFELIHGGEEVVADEWMASMGWLHRAYEFTAATPVLDLLTADGGLQLIGDPDIRNELSDVSSFLGVVRRFEEMQGYFIANEMIPWLNRNVDRYEIALRASADWAAERPASRFETDFDAIRTREFSNLLMERDRLLYLVTLFRNQALDRMENLRAMVRARLDT